MNSAVRRWVSIDGLVTLLLAANWIWFLLLFSVAIPTLFPDAPTEPDAIGAKQGSLSVFPLMLALLAASATATWACHMRRQGCRIPVLLGYGGCAAFGLIFIAIQVHRFSEPALDVDPGLNAVLLWHFAEHLSLSLLAGLALLLLASLVAVTRRGAEAPSLVEQATAWHWHALDTFWLVLVALAWHWGAMESL